MPGFDPEVPPSHPGKGCRVVHQRRYGDATCSPPTPPTFEGRSGPDPCWVLNRGFFDDGATPFGHPDEQDEPKGDRQRSDFQPARPHRQGSARVVPLLTEKNAMASLRLTVPPRQTVKPVATTAAYLGKGASNQVDSDRITRRRMRGRGYLTLFESAGRLPAAHEVGGICPARSNRSCASLSLRSGPTL